MSIVWCSISAHGFGHAAQVIPILNELGMIIEDMRVILRTCVTSSIFEEHLHVPWELQAVDQDIGCVQQGPLEIDIDGTWMAYEAFHHNWNQRVAQEIKAMNEAQPDLVISNISYLAIASAFQANFPVVAIASLVWDQVLNGLRPSSKVDAQRIIEHIKNEYGKAKHLFRLEPGIDMPAFDTQTDVGPSFPQVQSSASNLRSHLGVSDEETLVLLAFGGVPLTDLPLPAMESCEGFHFLVTGIVLDTSASHIHQVEDLPMSFGDVMRQVDVVMSKPGYVTTTTVVHLGIPLVYVRRHNFVDEQPLVDYAHQFGRAVELDREDFKSGHWKNCLQSALDLPFPPVPAPKPAPHVIAGLLSRYLHE